MGDAVYFIIVWIYGRGTSVCLNIQNIYIKSGRTLVWLFWQVWGGPLSRNQMAVVLWNRCSKAAKITANWDALGLQSSTSVSVRDLWQVWTLTCVDILYALIKITLYISLLHKFISGVWLVQPESDYKNIFSCIIVCSTRMWSKMQFRHSVLVLMLTAVRCTLLLLRQHSLS